MTWLSIKNNNDQNYRFKKYMLANIKINDKFKRANFPKMNVTLF